MKKLVSMVIAMSMLFSLVPMSFAQAATEAESTVIGVSTWKEFHQAFQKTWNNTRGRFSCVDRSLTV